VSGCPTRSGCGRYSLEARDFHIQLDSCLVSMLGMLASWAWSRGCQYTAVRWCWSRWLPVSSCPPSAIAPVRRSRTAPRRWLYKDNGTNRYSDDGISRQSVSVRGCGRSIERSRGHIAFFGYWLSGHDHNGRIFCCYYLLVEGLVYVWVNDADHFVVEA
jgi:hypothetical protein